MTQDCAENAICEIVYQCSWCKQVFKDVDEYYKHLGSEEGTSEKHIKGDYITLLCTILLIVAMLFLFLSEGE